MGARMLLAVLTVLPPVQDREERIRDDDYDEIYAPLVRTCEAIEKDREEDPAVLLRRLEEQVLSRTPEIVEARLAVVYTRGINRGEVRERRDFFPWRLAGRLALAAGLPEKAVEYLRKSPSSTDLLDRAKGILAEKNRPPLPAPPAPFRLDLEPFLSKFDFAGALRALEAARERLGEDLPRRVEEVRRRAVEHVTRHTEALATALPRLREDRFAREHLEPCLEACRGVPEELRSPELRWAQRLYEWLARRDPEEFDRLALEAAGFGEKYHVVCRLAQEDRLRQIEQTVEELRRTDRQGRAALRERLEDADRAFSALSAAHPFQELSAAAAAAKARIPADIDALDRAQRGAVTLREVRAMADELERIWVSETRERMGRRDRLDLAPYVGIYRSMKLFLEGKGIEEVAADPRVTEVFGLPSVTLPAGVSPKVRRVYERVRGRPESAPPGGPR